MKKQFFYAALAIGMMSSCSSNDLPGNQQPENPEDERVAIELGVSPLNAVVTTRSTGTGFVGNAENGEAAKWDKQPLNILMVKKVAEGTNLFKATDNGQDDGDYIFEGLEFSAPVEAKNNATSDGKHEGKITNDAGAVRYYPLTGAYDFFGWHFDKADATPAEGSLAQNDLGAENLKYTVTIDGTQDIMIGKATLTEGQRNLINNDLGNVASLDEAIKRAYSSWTARRDVHPIITFNHLLARLDFNAIVGQNLDETGQYIAVTQTAIGENYTDKYTTENGYPQPTSQLVNGETKDAIENGIYIKEIKVLNPVQTFDVTVASTKDENLKIDNQQPATDGTSFVLMQKGEVVPDGYAGTTEMVELVPVNAGYQKDNTEKVGNGIMIVPGANEFKMSVTLMQYVPVIKQEDQTPGETPEAVDCYEWKEQEMTTTVKLQDDKKFEAGRFYTIKITVYGFQKIEVHAELAAWKPGESIDSNPEDENFTTGQ